MSGTSTNLTGPEEKPSCYYNNRASDRDDWRLDRPKRAQKLAYILETQQFTDVTFSVGSGDNEEVISAHKLVLTMHSSVFEAMFHGLLASKDASEVIKIPDVEPDIFRILLKFIYTGQFEKNISVQEGLAVLYVAKKYLITDLLLVCTDFLKTQLVPESAMSVFEVAEMLSLNDLQEECKSFIIKTFEHIIKTEDFLKTSKHNLLQFLSDDEIRGTEMEIFEACLRWAEAECSRRDLDPIPMNRRLVLTESDVLYAVRFPTMTPEELALEVIPTEVLTPENSTLLLQHMVVPLDSRHLLPPLPFNSKKRSCLTYIARFYQGIATTAYVDISAGWFNKFSVDQPISIISFGFYGPFTAETADYEIHVKLTKDSSDLLLAEVPTTIVAAKRKEVFHVKFTKAVPVLPGNTYRAWFSLKGPLTCHGSAVTSSQEVTVPVNFAKFKEVNFTYNVTGAHQLPEIAFQT